MRGTPPAARGRLAAGEAVGERSRSRWDGALRRRRAGRAVEGHQPASTLHGQVLFGTQFVSDEVTSTDSLHVRTYQFSVSLKKHPVQAAPPATELGKLWKRLRQGIHRHRAPPAPCDARTLLVRAAPHPLRYWPPPPPPLSPSTAPRANARNASPLAARHPPLPPV